MRRTWVRLACAAAITVMAGVAIANEANAATAPGTGIVAGHITDEHHADVGFAAVTVESLDQSWSGSAQAGPDGRYRVKSIPPGRYRVSVYDNAHGVQWAHGQESRDTATVFTVTAGAVTVVNERFLPLATVTVTVTDKVTGKPVPGACAMVSSGQSPRGCAGSDGVVTIHGVQPGEPTVYVSDDRDGAHWPGQATAEVVRGKANTVVVALDQARSVVATVQDTVTGKPVNACATVVPTDAHGIPARNQQFCSDPATG